RPGLIAYSFSVFVLASIALEFARGTRARRSLAGGSWPAAFGSLVARNRRRYGGYVVHAAVVLLAIGVAGSSAYQTVRERHLRPGQSMKVAGYTLAFQGTTEGQSSNARELRTHLLLSRGDRSLGSIAPGKNYYPAERSSSNEVAIRHSYLTLEDVYVIADDIDPKGGGVYFKVLVKPLVNLIWLAGGVFVLGSLITLWPDAREERRLAARYRTEGALVRV
ncbi:MAG TPA: cytochrome c-type biogenesis CcmF C-terminal domain-containing protein, partial [Gaiellaceae bacterium]|nr:cytochrome c-type biogenesis CcmF C-terminal domain-containing protein [Gaiellaceae bacterium]